MNTNKLKTETVPVEMKTATIVTLMEDLLESNETTGTKVNEQLAMVESKEEKEEERLLDEYQDTKTVLIEKKAKLLYRQLPQIFQWMVDMVWVGTQGLWSLRVPLIVLASLVIIPKSIFLWLLFIVIKPLTEWLYNIYPQVWKIKIEQAMPLSLRNSGFMRDLNEGADQNLPFVLFWLYLCFAPFALSWIYFHWIKETFKPLFCVQQKRGGLVFAQNRKSAATDHELNFYHSKIFGVVFLAFFLSGIPAFFSYSLFENLGIENQLRKADVEEISLEQQNLVAPRADIPKMGIRFRNMPVKWSRMENTLGTVIQGVNGYWPWIRLYKVEPKKSSIFLIHFYLFSVASALSLLFFRTWFTFPLNFISDEHDIEISKTGVKRKSGKSWFRNVITINGFGCGAGPDSLSWNEIKCLRRLEEGFTRLCPLPENAFKKESLTYKLLNKLAALIDGISNPLNTGTYLVFSCAANDGDFGRNIKINLNELNKEQRAKLFYAVKKWAPEVVIDESAEKHLLGSIVLRHNRYTEIWFDMLTSPKRVRKQNKLSPGQCLKNGEYTVEARISSGGQASAYLARNSAGQNIVLKEFVLAPAVSSGALLESAREFETEVTILSQLDHPGIVKLEDFFSEQGSVYVVLEYIEGKSLKTLVQESGALDEEQAVKISLALSEILNYLHNLNPTVLHRDVTPENILILTDGSLKLIDFSLAMKCDGRQPTESCAKQCFTPPEQFREESCPQSDIYALGATMYYMLTAYTPKPISRSSPKAKCASVSNELSVIVERATELDLSNRYESVHWLKLDLERLANTIP